jgi:DNA invertase Pin-like site-specific DNA recombinase
MFQILGVFAEFERSIIGDRVNSGLARAKAKANGVILGRPQTKANIEKAIRATFNFTKTGAGPTTDSSP